MGITMTVMGRLGTPERPSFFPEGRTYSPPALRAVVSLSSVGPCALRGGLRSLRRAPDNTAEPAGIGRYCLCSWHIGLRPMFAASPQTVVLCRDNLPPACENLPQHKARPSGAAALSQRWTMLPRTVHFLLSRQKKQNRPLRGQKGSERLWRSIIWKLRL